MHLHIDCRSGMSGDMFLAALAHLGLDVGALERMFRQAGIAVCIALREESRDAGVGRGVSVSWPEGQPLRRLPDLAAIIERLDCGGEVRERSLLALRALGLAEAAVHGCPVEEVHFHEVGAIDTLVDVVGAFWGVEQLGIKTTSSTRLPWFSGMVKCEHGLIPLPAPATLELMRGKPVFDSGAEEELITPTGALLLHCLLESFALPGKSFAGPDGVFVRSGTGYGMRPAPRGLRLSLFTRETCSAASSERSSAEVVMVLDTHLDHLTGEELGHALEMIMQAGALDALWTPGLMKKGRPGGALRVLCCCDDLETVRGAVFQHTHTLGLRECLVKRTVLPREEKEIFGKDGASLAAKSYQLAGEQFSRIEFESLKKHGAKTGRSLPDMRFKK